MLHIHRSNHVEALAEQLAHLLRDDPLPDPMTPEQVAVPGRGIERWLSHTLARHLHATANIAWPFPGLAIERTLAELLGETADASAWQADRLAWAVLAALPARLHEEAFAPLRSWLHVAGPDASEGVVDRRQFQLAHKIADVFDRYATWRPDLALAWDHGASHLTRPGQPPTELQEADRWQPELWRDVRARVQAEPLYLRLARLERHLHAGLDTPAASTPKRLILFSISTLPELHLRAVQALAQRIAVHLFVLTPSQELWTHVRRRADIARQLQRSGEGATAEALLLEEGNPLLASLGRLGRDFQQLLEDAAGQGPEPRFIDPGEGTLLSLLQADVLHLRHRGRRDAQGHVAVPRLPLHERDDSVRIHACHGPTRQVEVLRDDLLALFAADPTLQPRDVVVMSPDVETFAPLIEAVFQAGQGDPPYADAGFPRIPVAVADRTLRHENPVAEVLLRVLGLQRGRATASEVLDLLTLDPVRRKFALEPEDLQQIQAWIADSGIRWGLDAEHRARHGQPEDPQNTWRFGLDRLLLGVAMADEAGHLFAGVLPFDEMEGGQVALLGKLATFCESLFALSQRLEAPRRLGDWQAVLTEVVGQLTQTSDRQGWLTRQVLDALQGLGNESGELDALLTGDAVHALLDGRFSVAAATKGLMTGAVTFCALVPLRSMPFRVVCLLGLDEEVFPRRTAASGFDLAAAHPRVGDRTPRDDDRYLFLEAVLAARGKLRIFFTGRDPQRNQERPPAVPVAELLDVAEASVFVHQGSVRDHLVRTHPLQPFSPRLFDPEAPRSYDRRMGIAAARLVGGRLANTPPLFTQPLPPPVDTGVGLSVSLRDLVRFFELPVKFLLQRRLGIYLGTDAAGLDDREPVELDSLQTWGLGDGILTRRLAGQTEAVAHAAMRASGQLPPGTLGQVAFETVAQRAVDILERTRARQVGEARAVLLDSLLDLQDFGSVRVAGTLDPVWADGLVTYRFGKVRAKHEIGAWIRHLALQLAEPAGQHVTAFLGEAHGNDPGEVVFPPLAVEVAREHLTGLVRLFLLGQQVPLAWFPSTSRDYASKWHDPRYEGDDAKTIAACKAAQQKWNPQGPGAIGDVDDAHTALVFTDLEPFRASTPLPAGAEQNGLDFHTLALAVWTPVLQARAAMEAA